MADPSGNDPSSNPFAFWLAQRQFEERRRADLISRRFNDKPSIGASTYQLRQLSPPVTGIASSPIVGLSPSSVGADGLLNTGATSGLASLLRTAALLGAAGLPEDSPLEAPLAGAALLASLLEQSGSGKPPHFDGGVPSSNPPFGPPPQGLLGRPIPNQEPPSRPTPPFPGDLPQGPTAGTSKPTTGTLDPNSGTDIAEGSGSAIPTPVPPKILTGPDLFARQFTRLILEYNPDGSRGNTLSERSNEILAEECMKLAKDRLPELRHIGGAKLNGTGENLNEIRILGPRGKQLNSSRPDVTFGLGPGDEPEHTFNANTVAMNKNGTMTSKEKFAYKRLIRNLRRFRDRIPRTGWIPKMRGGDSEDEYREKARAFCNKMLDQLLEELKEASPEDAENDGSAD